MKKLCLIFVFIALIFNSFSTSVSAATFSDLPSSHRFYDEMMYLEAEGIITGFPDGTFRPDGVVTRAAAAIMIGRALGFDGAQRDTTFSDVKANQVASGYIASAAARGIIQGYPNNTFRPNETVTRGQMAIFLSRAFGLTVEADAPFNDISPSMASYLHIKRIVAENLTQGYPDNTFRPNEKVTRAQYSAFIARALNDEFKVDLPVSYLKEKNKIYQYQSYFEGEYSPYRYVYSDEDYPNWNLWYVYDELGSQSHSVVERQDSEGLKVGAPFSEYSLELAFPIKVGHHWDHVYADEILGSYVITSTTKTISTPAGTFNHVVEVKESMGGLTSYYAPNIGLIQVTDGEIIYLNLTAIENR